MSEDILLMDRDENLGSSTGEKTWRFYQGSLPFLERRSRVNDIHIVTSSHAIGRSYVKEAEEFLSGYFAKEQSDSSEPWYIHGEEVRRVREDFAKRMDHPRFQKEYAEFEGPIVARIKQLEREIDETDDEAEYHKLEGEKKRIQDEWSNNPYWNELIDRETQEPFENRELYTNPHCRSMSKDLHLVKLQLDFNHPDQLRTVYVGTDMDTLYAPSDPFTPIVVVPGHGKIDFTKLEQVLDHLFGSELMPWEVFDQRQQISGVSLRYEREGRILRLH